MEMEPSDFWTSQRALREPQMNCPAKQKGHGSKHTLHHVDSDLIFVT
jgi:hypothetical protein